MDIKYYARIRVTTTNTPITVSVMARNYLDAEKKIEAMYAGSFKSWERRPTTNEIW